jgi:hypothetical protein
MLPQEKGGVNSRTFVLKTRASVGEHPATPARIEQAVGEKFWRYVFKQLFTICFYIKRQGVNF